MDSLEETFKNRTRDIDSIFSSYRELYQIYLTMMKSANVRQNNIAAFESAKKSADGKQRQISQKLYGQGFILLSGAAEALLRDLFEDLLINNFPTIKSAKDINFTTYEIQKAIKDAHLKDQPLESLSESLGHTIFSKIFRNRNPSEKINFQNVVSTKQAFRDYFDIEIPSGAGLDSIHRYWQMRHALIHTGGVIDERFRQNVDKVHLLKTTDRIGLKVIVNKSDFEQATVDFTNLFIVLDTVILSKGLSSKYAKEI